MEKDKKVKICVVLLLIAIIVTSLSGCAKVISIEQVDVDATITDAYHSFEFLQSITFGEITTMITHPATYRTYISYEGIEYIVDGSEIYDYSHDKIGEMISCSMQIITYHNGTIRKSIVSVNY